MDNIAALVTSESGTLEKLVTNIAGLAAVSKEQAKTLAAQQKTIHATTLENTKLREEVAALKRRGRGTGTASRGGRGERTTPPDTGDTAEFETGDRAYCWVHGYKLGKGHTGLSCKAKDFDEDPTRRLATRSNTMGGKQWNKGWDE